jgi:probable F420-dependent oxidoreductase
MGEILRHADRRCGIGDHGHDDPLTVCNDRTMKVRIGMGLGVRTTLNDSGYGDVVDALESLHFASRWLSERIGGDAPDPLVAMAFAAGRTTKLKFGMSVMVLPGRNPVVLAKELATLDRLSSGRLLPAFGLGVADPHEQQAFGVAREHRAKMFDEALEVVRGCWAPGSLTHHGANFHYDDLAVRPKPHQAHLDVWLGGIARSELRRVGRLADGWLPSFVTPDDVTAARQLIEASSVEHGRTIDPEHFGALVPYSEGPVPDRVLAGLAARRPDLADPSVLVPSGLDGLLAAIDRFVEVGTSKFVILPIVEPTTPQAWVRHLEQIAPLVAARQT